jgi:hypothetical protein
MALDRKDVRATVDHDIHAALVVFAKRSNCSVAEYVEKLIQVDVSSKVGDVRDAYDDLVRAGLLRKNPEGRG